MLIFRPYQKHIKKNLKKERKNDCYKMLVDLRTQGTPSSQAKGTKSTSYEVDLVPLACGDEVDLVPLACEDESTQKH